MKKLLRSILKTLFPAPLLSLLLVPLWLVMTQSYTLANLTLAVILGLGMPIFSASLRPLHVRVRKPLRIIRLCFVVMIDAWHSNLMVIRILLQPRLARETEGVFVRIPLQMRDPNGLAALAVITTITPGNAWAELSMDRSALLLHVFDGRIDPELVIRTVKERYERPLMEIFE
ncbi:Na+/H+ antiporter subunit E [Allofranklinella schreckenbergeri]|uniref:Na+/H+ antiporter subunit E n=1 Tax=Allofranklinella schreckenbergeri TaxID=1076744 RepID=UPI001EEEC8AC|nr:Na+/H+ antiporter subunit E [Allofranklinella schreckenbergeri]